MKTLFKIFLALVLNLSVALADDKTIIIGTNPTPPFDLLEYTKPLFKEKGWTLEIKEISDWVVPNTSLVQKELDANFFENKPFLNDFNKNYGANLVAAIPVISDHMGIYSKKIKNLDELKENSTIAIQNDPTNQNRALELLEKAGLIKLKNDKDLKTLADIIENPKKLKLVELKATLLPRTLDDVDAATIYYAYALLVNLDPLKDVLFSEDRTDDRYILYIVVRDEDKDSIKTKVIGEVLNSEEFRTIINEHYKGVFSPAF